MGCDIHTIWQKSTPQGWVDIPHEYLERRDYALFTVLAGVRQRDGVEQVFSGPRGLPYDFEIRGDRSDEHPTDIENVPREDHEFYDGEQWMGDHSYSFVSSWELLTFEADNPELAKQFDYFFNEARRLHGLHGEIRIVFGFDN